MFSRVASASVTGLASGYTPSAVAFSQNKPSLICEYACDIFNFHEHSSKKNSSKLDVVTKYTMFQLPRPEPLRSHSIIRPSRYIPYVLPPGIRVKTPSVGTHSRYPSTTHSVEGASFGEDKITIRPAHRQVGGQAPPSSRARTHTPSLGATANDYKPWGGDPTDYAYAMTVAEYPNALLDETTAGEVIVAELEMWTQPTAAFIRSSSGFEGTTEQWIGRYLLDDGNLASLGSGRN